MVGGLENCHVFADSIFLNNRSIIHFCRGKGQRPQIWLFFCGRRKCLTTNIKVIAR